MTGAGGVRMVPAGRAPMVGAVAAFDEDRGLGEIESGAGDFVPFHCTAITDGTRTITPGTTVAFELVAGRLGRLEATAVRPLYGVSAGDGGGAPGGSPPARSGEIADQRPVVALAGEEPDAEPDRDDQSVPSPGTGPSPTADRAGPGGDGGVGSRTPPPPPPWAPITDVVEPAPASDGVEPAPASDPTAPEPDSPTTTGGAAPDHPPGPAPDEPVPADPAASWPLGGGEPTPVTGTPVVVDPAPVPVPAPVPGAAGTEPSAASDGAPDPVSGEEPPSRPSAPPDGAPRTEESVDAPGPAGPPGAGPSEPGQQPDGSLGIRPSFDSAPYTGEVRVGGGPTAPAHPEPRVDPPGFHPDFWSPFARSRIGPPPTWMTPVTRREDDPATEGEAEDQDPGSEGR